MTLELLIAVALLTALAVVVIALHDRPGRKWLGK
jgi:hypothetical protein